MNCIDCDLKKLQECKCGRQPVLLWTSGCSETEWAGADLQDRAAFYGADD